MEPDVTCPAPRAARGGCVRGRGDSLWGQPPARAGYSRKTGREFCPVHRVAPRGASPRMLYVASPSFHDWLDSFPLEPSLRAHVAVVFTALPAEVRTDFVSDPGFTLYDYEPSALPAHIPVRSPSGKGPSRCVVLKRTLRRRPENFIRWVIA